MKRLLLLALLPLLAQAEPADVFSRPATVVQAQALLALPQQELRTAAGLCGHFEQKKYLAGLPQPLASSGRWLYARGFGVHWRTEAPLLTELVLTPTRMVQSGGGVRTQVRTARQPALALATRAFLALLSLQLESLQPQFELYAAGTPGRWQLGLKPADTATARAVKQILLRGGRQVEQVLIDGSSGERTEIRLSNSQALPVLSSAERSVFTE